MHDLKAKRSIQRWTGPRRPTASACAHGDDSAQSGKVADTSGNAPTGVTLTLLHNTLWHNTADPTALLDLYKAYEKKSGNTIELVDIPADSFPSTVHRLSRPGQDTQPTCARACLSNTPCPPGISLRSASEAASSGLNQTRSRASCRGRQSPVTGTT